APDRYVCGLRDSARCTPVTSWPASTARAAATAESTPPDMAASTRMASSLPTIAAGLIQPRCRLTVRGPGQPGPAGPLHRAGQRGDQLVDIGRGRGVPEREPQ